VATGFLGNLRAKHLSHLLKYLSMPVNSLEEKNALNAQLLNWSLDF
jgi:hypothetical protein